MSFCLKSSAKIQKIFGICKLWRGFLSKKAKNDQKNYAASGDKYSQNAKYFVGYDPTLTNEVFC